MVEEGCVVRVIHLDRAGFVIVSKNGPMSLDGEDDTARVDVVDNFLGHGRGEEGFGVC